MSAYTFTNAQAAIVTGPAVSRILGDAIAHEVAASFSQASPDAEGNRSVDLAEHRVAVLAALREVSPDTEDPTRQQVTEQLIKTLS
jgi:VIT1/CCC1 family predicted Fe2+/Mn2+ transporter